MEEPNLKIRHTVEENPDGICIILPRKKNVVKLLWFGITLVLSIAFECLYLVVILFSNQILNANAGITTDSMINSLVLILGSVVCHLPFLVVILHTQAEAFFQFFWQIGGREIIEVVTGSKLIVQRQIFRWKISREYPVDDVNNLRLQAISRILFFFSKPYDFLNLIDVIRRQCGKIAFDYRGRPTRFGDDLDETEAKMIVAVLEKSLSHATQP